MARTREPIDDDDQASSSLSSPSSTTSPLTPDESRAPSSEPTTKDTEDAPKEPASGPQRTRSASVASGKGSNTDSKEKRKRSRVTPEQLIHLERFFSMDRSPTAARRKEISESLGMQERQTQIWFQNRRAKAKLQDGKNKGRGGLVEMPPDTPPELCAGFDASLHNLIHEDEPVTIIPCTDLSIGTWKRIATTVSRHDLVAYVCETKRCLTWFIHSSGFGFKMEISFDSIVETKFTNAAPGTGLASFFLDRPPVFYMETVAEGMNSVPLRGWRRCGDWTEGLQATKILRHDLVGTAVQLAHLLRTINNNTSGSEIALHHPSYASHSSPSPGLQSPQIVGYVQPAPEMHPTSGTEYYGYDQRRRFSAPAVNPRIVDPTNRSPSMPVYPPSMQSAVPIPESMYSDYSMDSPKPNRFRPPELDLTANYHNMSLSRNVARRVSYGGDEPPHSSGSTTHSSYNTPSPPLLTTPYNPPGYWNSPAPGNMSNMRVGMASPANPAAHRLSYDYSAMGRPSELQ
ncbi:unnamed protein product [Somion occarium]|uniref:Homeobox domain-containing protein n=1 Tax=Somion occarium TaxID=3059160 RepID=A0ABP1E6Q3_9APHY